MSLAFLGSMPLFSAAMLHLWALTALLRCATTLPAFQLTLEKARVASLLKIIGSFTGCLHAKQALNKIAFGSSENKSMLLGRSSMRKSLNKWRHWTCLSLAAIWVWGFPLLYQASDQTLQLGSCTRWHMVDPAWLAPPPWRRLSRLESRSLP